MTALDKLEVLRRLPGVWINFIATGRTPAGDLAWSLSCKYSAGASTNNVQYVSTSLDEVVDFLATHLTIQGITAPPPTDKPKMKLKRST